MTNRKRRTPALLLVLTLTACDGELFDRRRRGNHAAGRRDPAGAGKGSTISGERTFDDGGGEITADRGDYSVSLGSGKGTSMGLLISSPCYRSSK